MAKNFLVKVKQEAYADGLVEGWNKGFETGLQFGTDIYEACLNDADIMGKDVFGNKRMTKLREATTAFCALCKWGLANQLLVAIEEMSEVQKAITKLVRANNPEADLDNLIEEIADATIMLEQLRIIFGINEEVCEAMDDKILRLKDRVVNG